MAENNKGQETREELDLRVKVRTADLTRANEELQKEVRERKRVEERLQEEERLLSSVFFSIQDGISILDMNMNIVRVNAAMEKWYAHNMPLVGKKCYEAYHCQSKPCTVCPTIKTLETKQVAYEVVPKRGPEGEVCGWLDLYSFPLIDEDTGKMQGVIEYVRDISARKEAEDKLLQLNEEVLKSEKKLKELSLIDSHTGLYNHRFLEEAIEAEFQRAKRYTHSLSVIMLDIDYFKSINDLYGHHFGDLILKQFSQQLKSMVRRYDTVVRFGGEEFLVVSPGIDRAQSLELAQRLLDALNLYNFGDAKHTVKLKISIAVASYPEDKTPSGMGLINLADQVLDKAKEIGGNRVYSVGDTREKIRPNGKTAKNGTIKLLQNKLERLTKKANQSLVEAIFALAKTIEVKDRYTGEHVESTVRFATEIAKRMGLSREEVELVREAAILHDLGKVGISEKLLQKKSKLTKKEFDEIKKHPQIAADILRPIQFLHGVIPFIFYHHERWDGKGYPTGIKGEEIPVGARIIAISDVFQALISKRPYRKAYPKEKAVEIIKKSAGFHFDPRIVDIFLKLLQEEKPAGRHKKR